MLYHASSSYHVTGKFGKHSRRLFLLAFSSLQEKNKSVSYSVPLFLLLKGILNEVKNTRQ